MFHHDAQHRLGAGGSDEHAPATVDLPFGCGSGLREASVVFPVEARRQFDVQQRLGIELHRLQLLAQAAARAHHEFKHLQRSHDPVARGVAIEQQHMPGTLPAQLPAAGKQFFEHITVAYGGTHELHALRLQRLFHREIGHQRTHHAGRLAIHCQQI